MNKELGGDGRNQSNWDDEGEDEAQWSLVERLWYPPELSQFWEKLRVANRQLTSLTTNDFFTEIGFVSLPAIVPKRISSKTSSSK